MIIQFKHEGGSGDKFCCWNSKILLVGQNLCENFTVDVGSSSIWLLEKLKLKINKNSHSNDRWVHFRIGFWGK